MLEKEIHIFAAYPDGATAHQFYDAMQQDFAVKGALMPDCHKGYSLPIGAVVATQDVVVPAWVGYDIGCGVCAYPVKMIKEDELRQHSQEIFDAIYEEIPVGFSINGKPSTWATRLSLADLTPSASEIAEEKNWLNSLGSLGGGNHFIEIGVDEARQVWVIIHSGSRGVGHGIAQHYMRLASPNRKASEGHYGLRVDSEAGKAYINDQEWCLQFALDNRREMLRRVVDVIFRVCHNSKLFRLDEHALINRNHNHVVNRDGLFIHRKGATHAEDGMMGVIPGNMRDGSFIVRGKGNPSALWSSSHGAGRILGRRKAKESLSVESFQEAMHGITARVEIESKTLDESPMAYKDIFEVMDAQSDLVDVVAHVRPVVNIKG